MRKLWINLFVVLLIVILLVGCGQSSGQDNAHIQNGQEQERESVAEQEINNENSSNSDSTNGLDESNISPIPDTKEEPLLQRTITLYFSDHELNMMYKEEQSVEYAEEKDLPFTTLQAWLKGPEHDTLLSLLPPEVIIEYVEDVDGVAHVSFSEEIKNAILGSSGEMMLIDQVVMILKQFNFNQTQILIEGEVVETLLGHMYIGEPIDAGDPELYEFIK